MLHLVIPARNEAPHITDTLRRLSKSLSDLTIPWQIIVADNGSTDQTEQTVNEFRISNFVFRNKLKVVQCPKVGKGAAIRHTADLISNAKCPMPNNGGLRHDNINENPEGIHKFGIRHSSFGINSVFGFIDADLSADPDAIAGMVARLQDDKADIVIASRLLVTKTTNRGWLRTLSSKFFNIIADLFLHLDVADAQCGLKIMNARGVEILKSCQEDGWFLDIEFLARARQDNLRIAEVPVPWIEFRYPNRKSQIRHFRDGIEAVKAIWRIKGCKHNPSS
jgi:glycosyltransferase involved in cell wall biosynthesis